MQVHTECFGKAVMCTVKRAMGLGYILIVVLLSCRVLDFVTQDLLSNHQNSIKFYQIIVSIKWVSTWEVLRKDIHTKNAQSILDSSGQLTFNLYFEMFCLHCGRLWSFDEAVDDTGWWTCGVGPRRRTWSHSHLRCVRSLCKCPSRKWGKKTKAAKDQPLKDQDCMHAYVLSFLTSYILRKHNVVLKSYRKKASCRWEKFTRPPVLCCNFCPVIESIQYIPRSGYW